MSEVSPRVKRVVWYAAGILLSSAVLVVLYYVGRFVLPLLVPFVLALLLSLLLDPMVRFGQERLRMPRGLAALGSILLVIVVVGSLAFLGVAQLVNELVVLTRNSGDDLAALQATIEGFVERIGTAYLALPPDALSYIDTAVGNISGTVQRALNGLLFLVLDFLYRIPGVFFVALVTLLATYFFSRDLRIIRKYWLRILPGRYGEGTIEVGHETFKAFRAYLKAQLLLVSITTAVSIIGLAVIGSPYAVSLGLLTGFFDLIPVLGPSAVFVPWIIYALFTGPISFAIKLAVVYGVVIILRQLLEARVVASSLGVHPLAVLAGIYIGLQVLGVAGLVLGPIVIIIVQAALKAGLTSTRKKVG